MTKTVINSLFIQYFVGITVLRNVFSGAFVTTDFEYKTILKIWLCFWFVMIQVATIFEAEIKLAMFKKRRWRKNN